MLELFGVSKNHCIKRMRKASAGPIGFAFGSRRCCLARLTQPDRAFIIRTAQRLSMSVITTYARLDADGIESCRTNPSWLEALYSHAIPHAEVADADKACDGIVWLLSRLPAPPSATADGSSFVLQRSLAPLLCGQGGTTQRGLNAPYGPASRLSSEQVAELSAWLQSVDPAQMRSRYDPHRMDAEQVYPQIWPREGAAAFDQYLLPHFRVLQAFFSRAAEAQQQVLVFFT
jgi:hypothetical protein